MDISSTKTLYTSVCANQRENSIKFSRGCLLFSNNRCPVVYDVARQAAVLLLGHQDEVNGSCLIHCVSGAHDDRTWVLSTSYDRSAIIWEVRKTCVEDDCSIDYKILYRFTSETKDSFATRCSVRKQDQFLSVTSSLDGVLCLWLNDKPSSTIRIGYCCFNSIIHKIDSYILLFLSGADNKVHIFQITDDNKLKHLIDIVGHQDWVKSLDILNLEDPREVLLASASQDLHLRVWHLKVTSEEELNPNHLRTLVSSCMQSSNGKSFKLTATLETILSGHEGIVHGVCWFRRQPKPALQLVSCSADKTIIVWKSSLAKRSELADEDESVVSDVKGKEDLIEKSYSQMAASAEVWREAHRFGETGEMNLPFLSVCLSDDESVLYAHSLHGSIHSWTCVENQWIQGKSITGHFGPVTGLAWERSGSYLLSCSLDKTCRLHCIAECDGLWHELVRPQVHGHELNCVASLGFSRFVSGAEEKTIRVFEATKFFVKNFKALSAEELPESFDQSAYDEMPAHAQLPALGLSNRGAEKPFDLDNIDDKTQTANHWYMNSKLVEQLTVIDHLEDLPSEEVLLQSTLWWEANKLYGHSNEIYALAVDSKGSFVASASKANRADLANILIWETSKFRRVASIEHHNLTVTQLKFSPNDDYLLSVSRDRTWCISEKSDQPRVAYRKLVGTSKSNSIHERIIWDCCWTHDSEHFMTVSRDRRALLWSLRGLRDQVEAKEGIDMPLSKSFESSIQAVDCCSGNFISRAATKSYLFAFGLEDGTLELSVIGITGSGLNQWQLLGSFTSFHQMPIRRLAFKPTISSDCHSNSGSASGSSVSLASAGDDCMVKLTRFTL